MQSVVQRFAGLAGLGVSADTPRGSPVRGSCRSVHPGDQGRIKGAGCSGNERRQMADTCQSGAAGMAGFRGCVAVRARTTRRGTVAALVPRGRVAGSASSPGTGICAHRSSTLPQGSRRSVVHGDHEMGPEMLWVRMTDRLTPISHLLYATPKRHRPFTAAARVGCRPAPRPTSGDRPAVPAARCCIGRP